ncbi:MAG: TlpA family protein disulfide reductase [Pigmentiphaga sp.]
MRLSRWSFPIGIDRAVQGGGIPMTMRAYDLQGTPSLVLIDRSGAIRLQHLGRIDDMVLGGVIGRLLAEGGAPAGLAANVGGGVADDRGCGPDVCQPEA